MGDLEQMVIDSGILKELNDNDVYVDLHVTESSTK